MLKELKRIFRRHGPLSGLSPEDFDYLTGVFRKKKFLAGQDIVTQGEVVRGAGFLISGVAYFLISDHKGNCVKFDYLKTGDFFGEMVLFSDRTSMVTIKCETDVTCYVLGIHDFCKLLSMSPRIKEYFSSLALERAREAYRALLERIQDRKPSGQGKTSSKISTPLERTVLFIKNNYMRPITLEEVSRFCGMSKFHFSRVFKAYTGYSFKEYLIKERLKAAKRLLKDQSVNVSEACYSVGFNDLSYFSRTFRKFEGVPPSEYLKTVKKTKDERKESG